MANYVEDGSQILHTLKFHFLELLKCKNEWRHWKEHETLVKKMVWFGMVRLKFLDIFQVESTLILLIQHLSHFL